MHLRTGIDLVEIARLDTQRPEIREKFLQRVFTPRELEICAGRPESIAGRFAAKEAAAKALGCGIAAAGWKNIEILRTANGEPYLLLHASAADVAARLGLTQWSVSITHTAQTAAAVVVAMG